MALKNFFDNFSFTRAALINAVYIENFKVKTSIKSWINVEKDNWFHNQIAIFVNPLTQ